MSGVAMKIDAETLKQFEALIEAKLIEHGLINVEPEMTREEAIEELKAFLEKGRNSPISPLSHDEIFDLALIKARIKKRQADQK